MLDPNRAQFPDRVRFNWGFHDATADAERGCLRTVTQDGPHNPRAVSFAFDDAYAAGYVAGQKTYEQTGKRPESSEPAWQQRLASSVTREA